MLFQALNGASKEEILFGHGFDAITSGTLLAISRGDYQAKSEADIQGSGYVVESLEAALWAFHDAKDFRAIGHDQGCATRARGFLDRLADRLRELAAKLGDVGLHGIGCAFANAAKGRIQER